MFLFLLNLQLVFFMILAAGYVLRKRGCADDRTGAVLSELLIMLILPCNIVSSFFTGMSWETVRDCALFLLFSFLSRQEHGFWENRFTGKQIPAGRRCSGTPFWYPTAD
mgnify:CR=1 FL=1